MNNRSKRKQDSSGEPDTAELALESAMPEQSKEPPVRSDSLPESLQSVAADLEKAMTSDGDLAAAYAAFADVAFRSGALSEQASSWLVSLFQGSITTLQSVVRQSDLVTELIHGQNTLTNCVAIGWEETDQLHKLVRLGEALLASHTKLHNPVAADFQAALAASLGVTRPKLAHQLIDGAVKYVAPEARESLQSTAIASVNTGLMLHRMQTDSRVFWTHRLRHTHQECDWESEESRKAVRELSEILDLSAIEATVLQGAMPDATWEELQALIEKRKPKRAESAAAKEPSEADEATSPDDAPKKDAKVDNVPADPSGAIAQASASVPAPKQSSTATTAKPGFAWATFIGGLLIGAVLASAGWYRFNPLHSMTAAPLPPPASLVNSAPASAEPTPPIVPASVPTPVQPVVAAAPPVPVPVVPSLPQPGDFGPEPLHLVPPPPAKTDAPAEVAKPAEKPSELEVWRERQLATLSAQFPSLHVWTDEVVRSRWPTTATLIIGTHPTAFATKDEHRALLKWLTLVPPQDPENRRSVLNTLIRSCPPSECLELFEPLTKFGAENAGDIAKCADLMLSLFEGRLSTEAKQRFEAVVTAGKKNAKN